MVISFEDYESYAYRAVNEDPERDAAEEVIAAAVSERGNVTGIVVELLADNFPEWSHLKCREVAARCDVPTRILSRSRLLVYGTHALLMLYDLDTGVALTAAVSEITKGSYPYQRTWEGETEEQYDERFAATWGPDPMGDWHGRNE